MSLESRSGKIVDEYVFKTGDSVKSIDEIYKRMRQKELQEKKVAKVEKELRGETDKLAKSTKKLAVTTGATAVIIGNLVTQGLMKLKASMGSVIRQALDFEDWVGKDAEAVKRLSASVKNLIPALDVARARTRLTTGDFNLNEKQLQAALKAAIHLTRVYKTDFATSLDKVSDVIKRGSSRSFKELGFNVDLVGTAVEKTEYALKAITERFGDMDPQAANANERIDQLKNTFWDSLGAMGASILKTDAVTSALKRLSDAAREIAAGIPLLSEKGRSQQLKLMEEKKYLEKGLAGAKPIVGRGFLSFLTHKEARERIEEIDKEFTANRLVREAAANKKRYAGEVATAKASADALIAEFERSMQAIASRRTGGRTGGRGARAAKPGWGGQPVGGEVSGADWQIQQNLAALRSSQEQAVAERELSDAIQERARSLELANRAMKEGADEVFLQRQWALNDVVRQNNELIMDLAVTSLTSLTEGLWTAADAALSGAQSWQQAMGGIAKAVALSAAKIATIEALKNVAYALHATGLTFLPGGQAAAGGAGSFWAAAAKWGMVAGVTGALGLGMSAAGVGGGGGGGAASGAGGGRTGALWALAGTSNRRTSIGKKVTGEDYTIVINNYWGNEKNPSKNYIQQQVITKVTTKNAA